jgi:quinol monooxygenase YgiN
MKSIFKVFAFVAVVAAMVPQAIAQGTSPSAPAYTVIYIETAPESGAKVLRLLRDVRTAARKSDGNLRYETLQRRERTNHFAILEVWKDSAAYEANGSAVHTRNFREALKPLLIAGYDERPHGGMDVAGLSAGADAKGNSVYVVTHVDFIPPKKDEGIAALRELASPSRQESGNLRYEVQQQNSRPNHLTLVEIWRGHKALEMHEKSPHVVRFRDMLLPMSGSLFDQRLYRALD